jgi:hypothetical protein
MTDFGGVLAILAMGLFVVGLISVFRPLRPVIRSRRDAAIAMAVSLVLFVGGSALIDPAELTSSNEKAAVEGAGRRANVTPARTEPEPPLALPLAIRKVDQPTVLSVDATASAGRFDVSVMANDDGTHTLLSRAYVSPADMAAMVDQGLIAAQTLLEWCRADGRRECGSAKDAYVWIERVGPDRGSLGFLFTPADWSRPVSTPEEAGDRAELLPGDHFGRDGLGVWCNIRREQPEGFCQRVRVLISPQV